MSRIAETERQKRTPPQTGAPGDAGAGSAQGPADSEKDYWLRRAYKHEPHETGIDPTRYGDWEYNGRCTDF